MSPWNLKRYVDLLPSLNENFVLSLRRSVLALCGDTAAVTAIEYALIAALIAVAIIGAVTSMGHNISGTFNKIASEL